MFGRCKLLLWAIPAIALLAFSAPARAGAGGMGQTGSDVCTEINQSYQTLPFFDPAAAAAVSAADSDLSPAGPCDLGSYPFLIVNQMEVLDSAGAPILLIPDTAPDNDCAAFNIIDAGSCVLAAVPEPARFPLAVLVIGSMGIVGYRTYRTRADRGRA